MKDLNREMHLPSYLSGSGIHPYFPPSLQVTVPLSGFRVKPLASAQHSVRVCVYVGGSVCVNVFFPSLQMMEAKGSPCFDALLSLLTAAFSSIPSVLPSTEALKPEISCLNKQPKVIFKI